jgi:hypothetical protein
MRLSTPTSRFYHIVFARQAGFAAGFPYTVDDSIFTRAEHVKTGRKRIVAIVFSTIVLSAVSVGRSAWTT